MEGLQPTIDIGGNNNGIGHGSGYAEEEDS